MSRILLDEYVRLLDEAFRQPPSSDGDTPSVLGNLNSVPAEAWDWRPPRGKRTIRAIVYHVGDCKFGYDDFVFRAESERSSEPAPWLQKPALPVPDAIAWMTRGHERFADSVAALADDTELVAIRHSRWGQPDETRNFITGMIHHDNYHAGEINHIRALFMENDGWAWE